MVRSTQIETKIALLKRRSEHSIFIDHYDDIDSPTIDNAKEYIQAQFDLMEHFEYLMLVDLGDKYINWTTEAKEWVASNKEFNDRCKVQAIVVRSLSTRLIFNLYLSFFKPKSETKFFKNIKDAEAFLDKKEKELFS